MRRGSEELEMKNKAPGVGLSSIRDRLRREYYDRWMLDPLRIEPGTKMPKLSADGKTTKVQNILGGDARRQSDALWHYLHQLSEERNGVRETRLGAQPGTRPRDDRQGAR